MRDLSPGKFGLAEKWVSPHADWISRLCEEHWADARE